jgi:hypothetical protein
MCVLPPSPTLRHVLHFSCPPSHNSQYVDSAPVTELTDCNHFMSSQPARRSRNRRNTKELPSSWSFNNEVVCSSSIPLPRPSSRRRRIFTRLSSSLFTNSLINGVVDDSSPRFLCCHPLFGLYCLRYFGNPKNYLYFNVQRKIYWRQTNCYEALHVSTDVGMTEWWQFFKLLQSVQANT